MKKLKLIILFIIIFLAGFLIANGAKYYLDMWKADRNVQAWMGELQAPYINDTYGGATPEETFDLYLAALKKGDLELASKYFVVNKQARELQDLQKESDLTNYIKELEGIDADRWTKQTVDSQLYVKYTGIRYRAKTITTIDDAGNLVLWTQQTKR